MAFGSLIRNQLPQQSTPIVQPKKSPKPPVPKAEPGSLYVRDTFSYSLGVGAVPDYPHGSLVTDAAKTTQFNGKVVPSLGDEPDSSATKPNQDPYLRQIGNKAMTREEALTAISASTAGKVTNFMDDQSDYLERVTKTGAKNTVANFSLGQSKAKLASNLYDDVLQAAKRPEEGGGVAAQMTARARGEGPHTRENYIKAFNIDVDKLKSEDPKVRQAEEKRLQQAVINHVSKTVDEDPKIDASMERWDDAVEGFEKNNNSVVIAASNEGSIEENMEKDNGGQQLKLPDDFETNVLENDLVTSVGATLPDGKGGQKIADWSSQSGGVDIYADGTVKNPQFPEHGSEGTSFAAPKVAATMAELHERFPKLSSSQIESLMLGQVTDQVANGKGTVPTLNTGVDLDSVKARTY